MCAPVLPTIQVPTLVLHRRGDRIVPMAAGKYMASQIPNAKFTPLEGSDHMPYGDVDAWVGEIEEFLTGTRREPHIDPCWQRSCSPTLSGQLSLPPGSATANGATYWINTMKPRGESLPSSVVEW